MNESEVLIGLTQVAIGVAGFSGLVYVLSPKDQQRASTSGVLIGMLSNAVVVMIHSLFGVFLQSTLAEPWAWASTFAVTTSVLATPLVMKLIAAAADDYSDVPIWIQVAMWVPSLTQMGLHFLNTQLFDYQSFGLFFLAQCLLLVTAIIQFMYMVVVLVSDHSPKDG